MLYAALTFWLLVIVFSAWGVHRIWSGLIKPRVVNSVLLPGTLVAQLGHVLGLLVTGNSVQNTSLMGDDENGAPQSATPERQRLPIVGSVIVALLPLVACGTCLHVAAEYWGQDFLAPLSADSHVLLPAGLPTSITGVWELLHDGLALAQMISDTAWRADFGQWQTAAFLYLAICLTVRMAPFEGNLRGSVGAILVSGVLIGIAASLVPSFRLLLVDTSWPVLGFAVGTLLFLLLVSLAVLGVVRLVRLVAKSQ
jgi:hypothetical protein